MDRRRRMAVAAVNTDDSKPVEINWGEFEYLELRDMAKARGLKWAFVSRINLIKSLKQK